MKGREQILLDKFSANVIYLDSLDPVKFKESNRIELYQRLRRIMSININSINELFTKDMDETDLYCLEQTFNIQDSFLKEINQDICLDKFKYNNKRGKRKI